MRRKFLQLIFRAILFIPLYACSSSSSSIQQTHGTTVDSTEQYAATINRYIYADRQDSIIIDMTPRFYRAVAAHDSSVCRLVGSCIAQAWLQTGFKDSANKYLLFLEPYMKGVNKGRAFTVYYNTLGHYALKYSADYSAALTNYLKVLDCAKKQGDISAQITMLYNIVYILYISGDPHGTQYAEEALRLSESKEASFFTKTAALIAMTEAEYLAGNYGNALAYLKKAHEKALRHNTDYWNPIIYLLRGDLLTATGDYGKAALSYGTALAESTNSEPSTAICILYKYGVLCQMSGDSAQAKDLYLMALDKSSETGSTEFMIPLLKNTAELFLKTGDLNNAARYYNELITQSNSLNFYNRDSDFKNLLSEYSALQYRYGLMEQSLKLSESRRTTVILIFLISLSALCITFILAMYSKQRRQNKILIAKYEEYRKRLLTENRLNNRDSNGSKPDIYLELYMRMEQMMKEGLFREKDLTLEKVAGILGSNRTYVSNALNKTAGISFYGYIDSYRIKEAVRILSNPELSFGVSLEKLAEDIGYNNAQTFFKAFKRETGATPGNYRKELLNLGKFTETDKKRR